MHELSLAESLFKIIHEVMGKRGATRLHKVCIRCGVLSNIVPDALNLAFEVLALAEKEKGEEVHDFSHATLEIEEETAILRCHLCGREFSTDHVSGLFAPCPGCHNRLGHDIISGRSLYLQSLEIS